MNLPEMVHLSPTEGRLGWSLADRPLWIIISTFLQLCVSPLEGWKESLVCCTIWWLQWTKQFHLFSNRKTCTNCVGKKKTCYRLTTRKKQHRSAMMQDSITARLVHHTNTLAQQIQLFLFFGRQINWSSSISTRGDSGRRRQKKKRTKNQYHSIQNKNPPPSNEIESEWAALTLPGETVGVGKRQNNLRNSAGDSAIHLLKRTGWAGVSIWPAVVNRCEQWRLTVARMGWLAREWAKEWQRTRAETEEPEAIASQTVRARLIWINPNWSFAYIWCKSDSLVRRLELSCVPETKQASWLLF